MRAVVVGRDICVLQIQFEPVQAKSQEVGKRKGKKDPLKGKGPPRKRPAKEVKDSDATKLACSWQTSSNGQSEAQELNILHATLCG